MLFKKTDAVLPSAHVMRRQAFVTNLETIMSYRQQNLPPISCWTEKNGVISNLHLSEPGYFGVARTDTVRRKRPPSYALLQNGTSANTRVTMKSDEALQFSYPASDGTIITTHTSVSEMASVGRGSESVASGKTIVQNKLRAKARGLSANLSNALGEYRQTASMFEDVSRQIFNAARALRSRNPSVMRQYFLARNVKDAGKKTAQQILQFNYGISPLIGDIVESVDALKRRAAAGPIFQVVNASHTETMPELRIRRYDQALRAWRDDGTVVNLVEKTQGKAWVTYKNEALNKSLGQFGITNPLATAYELVPWSFVVDWFFNVGEVLSSLDNCLYFETFQGQISTRETYVREVRRGSAKAMYKQISLARGTVQNMSTIASLRFKPSISTTHIANGLALFTQFLSSKR